MTSSAEIERPSSEKRPETRPLKMTSTPPPLAQPRENEFPWSKLPAREKSSRKARRRIRCHRLDPVDQQTHRLAATHDQPKVGRQMHSILQFNQS